MKSYAPTDIRNIALTGHSHSGKTSLVTALLKTAHMPVDGTSNGNAVTAYDEEELARGITMSNAVAFAEWGGIRINLIDTPGFHMFVHEARAAMLPAEAAVLLINAQSGIESVTTTVWNFAADLNIPRILVINHSDHPKASTVPPTESHWSKPCKTASAATSSPSSSPSLTSKASTASST